MDQIYKSLEKGVVCIRTKSACPQYSSICARKATFTHESFDVQDLAKKGYFLLQSNAVPVSTESPILHCFHCFSQIENGLHPENSCAWRQVLLSYQVSHYPENHECPACWEATKHLFVALGCGHQMCMQCLFVDICPFDGIEIRAFIKQARII